jgi:hypothetical protein
MSGLDREEYMQRFMLAEDKLHRRLDRHYEELRVCNPINVWACKFPWFYNLLVKLFGSTMTYNLILLYDLWLLMRCTDILMLRGYDQSKGSCIERFVATKMGIGFIKGINV